MKILFSFSIIFMLIFEPFCQVQNGSKINSEVSRGPVNLLSGGVIDGPVINEDIPLAQPIPYPSLRSADFVWKQRVFSRIDSREILNFDLFNPHDKFTNNYTENPPQSISEMVKHKGWIRNQERLSLWTIIMQHLMTGELTMYLVSDSLDYDFLAEDGYMFKYELKKLASGSNSYFDSNNKYYKQEINKRIAISTQGDPYALSYQGGNPQVLATPNDKSRNTYDSWIDFFINNDYDPDNVPKWESDWKKYKQIGSDRNDLERAWKKAMNNKTDSVLYQQDIVCYLTSDMITAYNIKEEWYFNKSTSTLNRQIIAIAPVAKFTTDPITGRRKGLIVNTTDTPPQQKSADLKGGNCPINAKDVNEFELFWLYYPELRNVIANYYIYNDKNDAQQSSFDDILTWRRKFSSQVYKASDKFGREIFEYKNGTDALYEGERIKNEIRTWEIDIWNY